MSEVTPGIGIGTSLPNSQINDDDDDDDENHQNQSHLNTEINV